MECLARPAIKNSTGSSSLAEAVILQALSDLWNEGEREESVGFFKGEGFLKYADISGMSLSDRLKVLEMVEDVLKGINSISRNKRKHRLPLAVPEIQTLEHIRPHHRKQIYGRTLRHDTMHI